MHTTTQIKETFFIHRGSYDGDVTISHKGKSIIIPCHNILEFAANYAKSQKIAKLEETPWWQILEEIL